VSQVAPQAHAGANSAARQRKDQNMRTSFEYPAFCAQIAVTGETAPDTSPL
jgi:hypothetical protein